MTTPPPPPPGPGQGPGDAYGGYGPPPPPGGPPQPYGPPPGGPPYGGPPGPPHGGPPGPPGPPAPGADTPKTLGIVSLVLGIVGLPATCCCWFIGWIFPVGALVTGIIGYMRVKDEPAGDSKPFLVAGMALGAVGMVLLVLMVVLVFIGNVPEFYDSY